MTLMNNLLDKFIYQNAYSHATDFLHEMQKLASDIGIHLPDVDENLSEKSEEKLSLMTDNDFSLCPNSTSYSFAIRYNYALMLYYTRQFLKADTVLASCFNTSSCAFDEGHTALSMDSVGVSNMSSCPDKILCGRTILLWLEVLLRLHQPERVFEICDNWLALVSSLSLRSECAQTEHSLDRIGNKMECDLLQSIRKPLQLFYIRACLLTGRLEAATEEINIFESESEDIADKCEESSLKTEGDSCEQGSTSNIPKPLWFSQKIDKNSSRCLLFLKAQLAYLKNNYTESFHCLSEMQSINGTSHESGFCESSLIHNNLGLIHHRSGRFHLSGLQFRHALRELDGAIHNILPDSNDASEAEQEDKAARLLNQVPLHLFSLSEHHALLYNLSLQLLFARKPAAAFSTLLQLTKFYPRNPRLWLRLAECCIKLHRPNNLQSWQLEARSSFRIETVGIGPCRTVMLVDNDQDTSKLSANPASLSSPSLEFGFSCLRNALLLLPQPPSDLFSSSGDTDLSEERQQEKLLEWADTQSIPVMPAQSPLRGLGLLHLLSVVHLNIAYVALCLGNPIETIPSAKLLLEGPSLFEKSSSTETEEMKDMEWSPPENVLLASIAPPAHRFLARLYVAEALVDLDRVTEAIGLLRFRLPDAISEAQLPNLYSSSLSLGTACLLPCPKQAKSVNSSSSPGLLEIYSSDFPRTGAQATGLLLYNLAAALATEKLWTPAELLLQLSLSGLSVSFEELNGHKYSAVHQPALLPLDSPILPLPAILLRIYLSQALKRPDQTLSLIREYFGHTALAGRLHSPQIMLQKTVHTDHVLPDKTRGWTMNDLRQLLKASMNSNMSQIANTARTPVQQQQQQQSNIQRPTSLWAPTQQHLRQSLTAQTPNYPPSFLQNQTPHTPFQTPFGGRWDQQSSNSQTHATGVITAANESDWPPL